MFYIEWLQAINSNGEISDVRFTPGLNIIVGPSNRGKTMILKCIDYLLGAKLVPLRKEKYAIELLKMKIITNDGYVILSRKIDEDYGTIESHTSLLPNGTFRTDRTTSDFNYGQTLMGLFGVDVSNKPVKIFKTKDAKVVPLSIRQIINTFIIKENPIIDSRNIFVPNGSSITNVESAILFQMTGNSYVTGNEKDSNWVKQKKEVQKYITSKINELEKENDWLTMAIFDEVELGINENAETMASNLDSEYLQIQEKYNDALNQFADLGKITAKLRDQLNEQEDMINKCSILKDQYDADVKRIKFSLDGNKVMEGIHEPECCPFCGNSMKEEQEHDCLEALRNDLNDLVPKIKDLNKEIIDLNSEKIDLEKKYNESKKKYDDLNSFLNENYRPQIKSIKNQIKQYGDMVRDAKEKEIIRQEYKDSNYSLERINSELANAITSFDPTKYLNDFCNSLSQRIKTALTSCNFPNATAAKFDNSVFDIMVGNDTKADYGKGFVAFLNSICTSTLHHFVNENAEYKGSPFIIDSPVMSLKEIQKLDNSEIEQITEMKKPLFDYFLMLSNSEQIIVIENEIPEGFVNNNAANIIEYGQNNGRYGFLINQK